MRGLAIPVRAFRGRAVLAEGDEKNAQVITLCIADGENTNPFNTDVGLIAPIFALDTPAVRAIATKRTRDHFTRLRKADRARLERVDFKPGAEGDLDMHVVYVDLETDEELEAVAKIARG